MQRKADERGEGTESVAELRGKVGMEGISSKGELGEIGKQGERRREVSDLIMR